MAKEDVIFAKGDILFFCLCRTSRRFDFPSRAFNETFEAICNICYLTDVTRLAVIP